MLIQGYFQDVSIKHLLLFDQEFKYIPLFPGSFQLCSNFILFQLLDYHRLKFCLKCRHHQVYYIKITFTSVYLPCLVLKVYIWVSVYLLTKNCFYLSIMFPLFYLEVVCYDVVDRTCMCVCVFTQICVWKVGSIFICVLPHVQI